MRGGRGDVSTYQITFKGEAGSAVRAAFEGFDVAPGHGVTVLTAVFPDQAALHGAIHRVEALGLELVDVHLVGGDSRR
jgi:hypothetical protein